MKTRTNRLYWKEIKCKTGIQPVLPLMPVSITSLLPPSLHCSPQQFAVQDSPSRATQHLLLASYHLFLKKLWSAFQDTQDLFRHK